MQCIRTGADVYLMEYDAIVHGDLFKSGSTYILNSHGCANFDYQHRAEHRNPTANITFMRAYKVGSLPVWCCEENSAGNFEYDGGLVLL